MLTTFFRKYLAEVDPTDLIHPPRVLFSVAEPDYSERLARRTRSSAAAVEAKYGQPRRREEACRVE